jgi:hypothetical protein
MLGNLGSPKNHRQSIRSGPNRLISYAKTLLSSAQSIMTMWQSSGIRVLANRRSKGY